MIPFNFLNLSIKEKKSINTFLRSNVHSSLGHFTKKSSSIIGERIGNHNIILTNSCTAALEMCALLINIKPGDEVIMPSYTFISTANAFALRGAKLVFVDINIKDLNLNPDLAEKAINKKTKASEMKTKYKHTTYKYTQSKPPPPTTTTATKEHEKNERENDQRNSREENGGYSFIFPSLSCFVHNNSPNTQ